MCQARCFGLPEYIWKMALSLTLGLNLKSGEVRVPNVKCLTQLWILFVVIALSSAVTQWITQLPARRCLSICPPTGLD